MGSKVLDLPFWKILRRLEEARTHVEVIAVTWHVHTEADQWGWGAWD